MKPLQILSALIPAFALVACATPQTAPLASLPVAAVEAEPAGQSLADLVAQVDIPYEQFTLPNGLTTLTRSALGAQTANRVPDRPSSSAGCAPSL